MSADLERTSIKFKSPTQVVLGARSRHDHPAGTISTTDDPEDMMSAVSMLGSALKSTNPERSYPTLRGHPPLIERGDSLSIPNTLSTPETGVRIELPPEYRYIYPATPLAYYLGAVLVPSDEPRLITGTGLVHPLDSGERAYEDEIERLLKQVFFLDCITRTEGLYKTDLHERAAVEDSLGWDPATIYEQSLAEQLDAYLSVPFEAIEPHIPTWKLESRIDPTPSSIEALPFLVNDLAVVRTPDIQSTSHSESLQAVANDFLRDETFTRSMDKSPNSGDKSLQAPEIEKLKRSLMKAW
ncbi:hypothetical protein [Halospeciosus flavus]|uniref:hypothetical protein n=1 Tax=Halospeciosus flavus TaxID=3032283 RepID=UPI0036233D0F